MHLWYGTGDLLADVVDVEILKTKLVNANVKTNKIDQWGHISFNIAKNGRDIYTQLINELKASYATEFEGIEKASEDSKLTAQID